jgi:hypothetical protein
VSERDGASGPCRQSAQRELVERLFNSGLRPALDPRDVIDSGGPAGNRKQGRELGRIAAG